MTLAPPVVPNNAVDDVGELQVRLPAAPDRLSYLDELADAFGSDLDQGCEYFDGVEIEGAEVCAYLYGADPSRLVAAAGRVLARFPEARGAYGVQTLPGSGGSHSAVRVEL